MPLLQHRLLHEPLHLAGHVRQHLQGDGPAVEVGHACPALRRLLQQLAVAGHVMAGHVTCHITMTVTLRLLLSAWTCRFPGTVDAWDSLVDVTDADLLAEGMLHCATTPACANQAFNICNGDCFRWKDVSKGVSSNSRGWWRCHAPPACCTPCNLLNGTVRPLQMWPRFAEFFEMGTAPPVHTPLVQASASQRGAAGATGASAVAQRVLSCGDPHICHTW